MDADTGETIPETSTISKGESEKPVTENKSRSACYYRFVVVINLHVEIRAPCNLLPKWV